MPGTSPSSCAPPGADQDSTPRRSGLRRPASWDALIRLPDGTEQPCVVKDVSKFGARLCVPITFPLPRTFLLKVEKRGFAFSVSIVWRTEDHVGVRIERFAKLPPVRADDARAPEAAAPRSAK